MFGVFGTQERNHGAIDARKACNTSERQREEGSNTTNSHVGGGAPKADGEDTVSMNHMAKGVDCGKKSCLPPHMCAA